MRYVPLAVYIATIVAANAMVLAFGFWPVWPFVLGLAAPAGTYAAGLAFTARDLTQDSLGKRWVIGAILIGAGISGLLSRQLALASAVAFLVGELADFGVYTPLRERRWLVAVAASNAVGLVIDSALFLWLAFGSLEFLWGQVLVKLEMTVLAIVVLGGWRAVSARYARSPLAAAD